MNRPTKVLFSLLGISALTFGLAVPAHAYDEPADKVGLALEDLTGDSSSPASDVLSDVAQIPTDSSGATAIEATIAGIDVVVPTDPSSPVSLESSSGNVISMELPFAEEASNASVITEGVVAYDNNNGSITAPVVKDDGSVQVTTVIEGATAPTEYSYDLGLPEGASALLGEDGNVTVLDADGAFLAGVAPAWAKDANGQAVPTHYVLAGSTLTQVVEHASATYTYPVVADPWLGIALVSRYDWSYQREGYRLNVTPTGWARALNYGTANSTWQTIGLVGWDELVRKQDAAGRSRLNSSLMNQWICHQGFGSFEAQWNLERWRPDKGLWGFVGGRCN